jgi:sulfur carrier protein
MSRMDIIIEINGEKRCVPAVESVRDLLRHLELGENKIAVEINRKIVLRREWDKTPVNDQDKIEIVQFVGGG